MWNESDCVWDKMQYQKMQCKASLSSQWILFTIQNICEFVLQNTCYPNDADDDEQHTTRAQNQGTTKKTAKFGTAHILLKVLL